MVRTKGSYNHEYCTVDEIAKLMNQGYVCYIEEDLWIEPLQKGRRIKGQWMKCKRGKKATVDIYAVKNNTEILIEIGTLSNLNGERLSLLKQLKPNAKIIHVHQWKNYGITEDVILRAYQNWRLQMFYYGKIFDPNLGNDWFSGCFNYKELGEEELNEIHQRLIRPMGESLAHSRQTKV